MSTCVAARARLKGCVFTGKSPLYFQHQGHSRTIIGIERESCAQAPADRDRDSYTLLVLDPSMPHAKLMTVLQRKTGWQVRAVLEAA